jgi:hypothetical protein
LNKTLLFRLGLILFLLIFLYLQGASLFLLGFLALLFGTVLLFRERAYKGIEKLIDEKMPFTKKWPGWAKWALVFFGFLAIYYVLKLILYSVLAGFGFDVQGELGKALNVTE